MLSLSSMRKHTGLLMFVMAFVFIGLAFFGDNISLRTASGTKVLSGKFGAYTDSEYLKVGRYSGELAYNMPSLERLFVTLRFAPGIEHPFLSFFVNRLLLQKEAQRLGITPSLEEIKQEVMSMPEFQTDNVFDVEKFNKFSKRQLGYRGLGEEDFLNLVRDKMSFDRLSEILATGVNFDSAFSTAFYDSQMQSMNLSVANLSLNSFKDSHEAVADDVLKKFWEPNKNRYMVEEKRDVTVYELTPTEKITDVDDKTLPEASQKVAVVTENVWDVIVNKKNGLGLDQAMEEAAQTNKELFSLKKQSYTDIALSDLPKELTENIHPAAGQNGTLGTTIFSQKTSINKADSISNVSILKDGKVVIFEINKVTKSVPKSFESAKAQALADYREETAVLRMDSAADKLRSLLAQGIKEGKSFADLAKDNKATITQEESLSRQKLFDTSKSDTDLKMDLQLFEAARLVNTGDITKVVKTADKRAIALVNSKELAESAEINSEREAFKKRLNTNYGVNMFYDWLFNAYRAQNIKYTEAMNRILSSDSHE